MQKTAREIAELLHGTVEGEKEVLLQNFAKIEEAGPGDLTFLSNPAYEAHLYLTRASAAIVAKDFQPKSALPAKLTLLRVADPYAAFATLLQWASTKKALPHEIHATAVMGENTEVSSSCFIGPLVTIGKGVRIGDNCEIHSNTIIGEGCEIGNGTVVLPESPSARAHKSEQVASSNREQSLAPMDSVLRHNQTRATKKSHSWATSSSETDAKLEQAQPSTGQP
jgi:UDP-3-O-[3-hydroxymyristoyl] glucosamine N-acyltransferase